VKPPSFGASLTLNTVATVVRLMHRHHKVQRASEVRVLDSPKEFGSLAGLVKEPKNGSAN
jgi:hypothetical protein